MDHRMWHGDSGVGAATTALVEAGRERRIKMSKSLHRAIAVDLDVLFIERRTRLGHGTGVNAQVAGSCCIGYRVRPAVADVVRAVVVRGVPVVAALAVRVIDPMRAATGPRSCSPNNQGGTSGVHREVNFNWSGKQSLPARGA